MHMRPGPSDSGRAGIQPLAAASGLRDAAPRVSLGEIVAQRLRDAIFMDDLSPGQHLREEEISDLLQVSRGPVRNAFVLLEREGLVQLLRHRGARVVDLSATDLGEVYSLRSAIEDLAVRLAIHRHQASDLEALSSSLAELRRMLRRSLTDQVAARLDVEFHDAIFRAAHHERLYESWSAIRGQVYLFLRRRNLANSDWRVATAKGHADILDLIRAGDEDAAAAALREHISIAYGKIVSVLQEEAEAAGNQDDPRRVAESYLFR